MTDYNSYQLIVLNIPVLYSIELICVYGLVPYFHGNVNTLRRHNGIFMPNGNQSSIILFLSTLKGIFFVCRNVHLCKKLFEN